MSGGVAFGIGQESTINGESKDDRRENLVFGVRTGYSINRNFGVSVAYLGTRALADVGLDFDSAVKGVSDLFLNELMKTEDTLEGIASFEEKRRPVWKNK